MDARVFPTVLALSGCAGALVAGALALGQEPRALPAVVLALIWCAAGWLAVRAQPAHLSARLLLGVGSAHLTAFGLSAVTSVSTGPGHSWAWWLTDLVANLVYAWGFAALATLFVVFPAARLSGRTQRLALWGSVMMSTAIVLLTALSSPALEVPLQIRQAAVPAPSLLPVGHRALDWFFLVPLMVVASLVSLVVRARRASGPRRRQLMWPTGIASVLVLMLLATPAGTRLLGTAWSLVFVPVVAGLPLALLAGVARFRLLQVDLYVGRTLAYAAVGVLVVSVYALAAAVAVHAGRGGPLLPVAVATAAAFTGHRLRLWLQGLADRLLTGGKVQRRAVVQHLVQSLQDVDLPTLALRTAQAVASGLDVAWVHVRMRGQVIAEAGYPCEGAQAELVAPLWAAGEEIGGIECGPRHGGWGEPDRQLLGVLAGHAALALRGAELTSALASRVQEVVESRARLVLAEDLGRRRLERDLHDGIQQQLVVLLARLELLRSMLDADTPASEVASLSHEQARRSLVGLRDVVRGIHPPLLGDRGLVAAVQAQADLVPLPVVVDVDPRLDDVRFPPALEAAAYYVVCEAMTNVLKHAGAQRVQVRLALVDGLQVAITDRGRGFDSSGAGSGLAGLRDRVEALGGRLDVESVLGGGTTVTARFPTGVVAHA